MKLRIHKGAAEDLSEAARWYNDQRDQLGVEFALAFYESIDTILESPNRWPEIS